MISAADIFCLVVGVLGLGIGALRTVFRDRFGAIYPTILAYSLGLAVLVRSPGIGDIVLDDALYHLTGKHNLPDLLGHLLTFVAMGAALGFFSRALGYRHRLWRTYGVIAVLMAVIVALFLDSPAPDVRTENIVQIDGLRAYAAMFSFALIITHIFGLVISRHGRMGVGWAPEIIALYAGTCGGIAMAAHRLLAVGFPQFYDWGYSPITWCLSLVCIGGYVTAVWVISVTQARENSGPGDIADKGAHGVLERAH